MTMPDSNQETPSTARFGRRRILRLGAAVAAFPAMAALLGACGDSAGAPAASSSSGGGASTPGPQGGSRHRCRVGVPVSADVTVTERGARCASD